MKQYLKHPIITNPAKWLLSIKRYQGPELYQPNSYQSSLDSNPFAQSLVRTHKDPTSFRFPNGSVIRLEVENNDASVGREKGSYLIVPKYDEKDHQKLTAPSYILGNQNFLNYVDRKGLWMRYLSLKYKNKTDSKVVGTTSIIPDFKNKVKSDMEDRINNYPLDDILRRNDKIEIGLNLTNSGNLVEVNGQIVKMNIPNINHEGFVPFSGNEKLCFDLLRLMRYYL